MFRFGKVLFTAFIFATSTSDHVRGTEIDGSSTNPALTDDTDVTTTHQTGELDTVQPVTDDAEDEEERMFAWATKLRSSIRGKWKAMEKSIDMKTIERLEKKEEQLRKKALNEKATEIARKRYDLFIKHGGDPKQYYTKLGLDGQGPAVKLRHDPRFLDYLAFSEYWGKKRDILSPA
uniref:RxLR effector protein n=1 Tax=Peronospora matthiolae TaxID=2874970 RepID=A0AAV1VCG5_9STRA